MMKDRRSAAAVWTFEPALPRRELCEVCSLSAVIDQPGMSPGAGGFRVPGRLPVPRQQRIEFVSFGCPGHDAFKHIGQPRQRLDAIQLRALDEGHDDSSVPAAAVSAREQGVLSAQRDRPDGTLDGVGIQFQTAIIQEQYQPLPVVQRVTDRLGQRGPAGDMGECLVQPDMHRVGQRPALLLTDPLTVFGGLAAQVYFNRVKCRDPAQRLFCQRRLRGGENV